MIMDFRGKTPKKLGLDWSSDGEIAAISAKNIKHGQLVNLDKCHRGSVKLYNTWMKDGDLKKGDLLLTSEAPLGEWYQVRAGDKFILSQRTFALRPNPRLVDADYFASVVGSRRFQNVLHNFATGTTVMGIRQKTLLTVPIELPDIDTQRKIGQVISDLHTKFELNQQINNNLLRLMDVQWNKMFGSLNTANGHFKDLATIVAGGTPSKKKDDYFGGNISWITPKDMSLTNDVFIERGSLNITEAGLKGSSAKLLPKGTLLFSSRAPIGYLGIAANPVTTNQGFKSLIPKRDENTEYLYFLLKNLTPYIEGIAGGSTFKEISGAGMKSVEFPLPTDNQIDAFHNIVTPMFDMVRNNEQQNKKLTDLRDLLLPRLLAGNIDLSNIETVMNNA